MDRAGMVHALEEIHRIVRSNGVLIEIHPIPEAPTIEIRSAGDLVLSEDDPSYDYEDDLLHAERAVSEVARRGRFSIGVSHDFDFATHASSIDELRAYWDVQGAYDPAEKDEAVLRRENDLYERAEQVMAGVLEASVVYHERARLTRMTPLR
jgi:hypothetical protein